MPCSSGVEVWKLFVGQYFCVKGSYSACLNFGLGRIDLIQREIYPTINKPIKLRNTIRRMFISFLFILVYHMSRRSWRNFGATGMKPRIVYFFHLDILFVYDVIYYYPSFYQMQDSIPD